MNSYETECENAAAAAVETERAAKRLAAAAKAMTKAAAEGNHTKLRQSVAAVAEAAEGATRAARAAGGAWSHTDEEVGTYLSTGYEDELIAAAARQGVTLSRLDDRLAAFPVVVQMMANQRSVRVDNVRLASLRPSFVAERIKAQQKKASTRPDRFIEVLFKAYERLVDGDVGRGVTMAAIYDLLTILPDAKRSYGKAEFARDVFLLDTSTVHETKKGQRVSFPAATGTKGGSAFVVVPPDGMPKHYYGLRFEEPR